MRTHVLFMVLGTLGGVTALSRSGCLCTSDQPCWPSAATFSQLQTRLSQPLVYPLPSAWACYPPSDPSGNCTDVNANWGDGFWRASHPGSMEEANWEVLTFPNGTVDACYLNTSITGTCGQGRVPTIGADVRSIADVQAALGFAVDHGLKVVVKNTGHDYVGRSTARGAFQVWTHNMKNITYDAVFIPQGAPANETYEALTLGAGVQWKEAYDAVHEQGRMMVGGISAGSVGAAGGWLAGGGHSFLAPSYGLGVDNALEISIVLSTGEYLVTNAYQNSDLFWALRGGGGGTYGIVISATYRTYPAVPIQRWTWNANVSNSSVLPTLFEELLRFEVQVTEHDCGGYSGISGQGANFLFFNPSTNNETFTVLGEAWNNTLQSLIPYGVESSDTHSSSSWYDTINEMEANSDGETGIYFLMTSRILTRETIAKNASRLAQVLVDCEGGSNPITGGRVNQFAPDSAGLHPAWRKSVTHVVCGVFWDEETSSEEIQSLVQQLQAQTEALSELAPDDAAYLNEASPYEIDWQKTFFGPHYPRLKGIKDKYDPIRLFVVPEGVGSDEWNKNLTCRY